MLKRALQTISNLLQTPVKPDKALQQPRGTSASTPTIDRTAAPTSDDRTSNDSTNGVILQYFHWNLPPGGNHWNQLQQNAAAIAAAGFTALWLPPAYKGRGGGDEVGYGVYDLFDLGEFDQKGTVATKYGSKDQLIAAIKAAQSAGLQVYADVVFNHKDGGDATELIRAIPFARDDRNTAIGEPQEIEAYTQFNFPGRGDKYSSLKWNRSHFDSVNHNMRAPGDSTVYLFEGQSFEKLTDLEKGNYDFLLGCDLDMDHPQVQDELKHWGKWFLETTGVDGFRLDAVKHVPTWFFCMWLDSVRDLAKRPLFCVGEYWTANLATLKWYLEATGDRMSLFDVPLQNNFRAASCQGRNYDLRKILDGTLMQEAPLLAVTFVENHDTQPLQSLENPVEPWFKPIAYALILLRQEGYPCVFYADYYGADYTGRGRDGNSYAIALPAHNWLIEKFLYARQHYAYGKQYSYFDHPNTIGWTRLGDRAHPKAMAVLLSNGDDGAKWMEVGKVNTTFTDLTGHIEPPVQTNSDGWGEFQCRGGKVSVWVEAE
jgi:alpha-amylase